MATVQNIIQESMEGKIILGSLLIQKLNNTTPSRKLTSSDGQATVEFVLTFILLIAFVLFFYQLAVTFAFGSYVHYATFMSARAYLASGQDIQDQQSRAKDVVIYMLKKSALTTGIDKFPMFGKGVGGGDPPGLLDPPPEASRPGFSWMQGIRYSFKSRLFMLPLGRMGSRRESGDVNSVTLTAESWLGREYTVSECEAQTVEHGRLIDNGC